MEKAKIKSKWKLEKRRDGLAGPPKHGYQEQPDGEHLSGADAEVVQEENSVSRVSLSSPPKTHLHPSRAHMHPDLAPKGPSKEPKKSQTSKEVVLLPTKSLRELTKEAYSPASLHTYKADPLKRRETHHSRGRGGSVGRGRGQPNMMLRMGAMLEKIKQDLA